MGTIRLADIQGSVFEKILLNRQLTPLGDINPQADCGRQVEEILEKEYFAEDKLLNGEYPTFSDGVDIQSPYGYWEIKTRQMGGTSRVNIGAITTSELDVCQKYNLDFEDTDFSKYACNQLWVYYNSFYKIENVVYHDMSYHKDLFKKAYEILKNTEKCYSKNYIPVLKSEMIWEKPSNSATQWTLRVTDKKLKKLFRGCEGRPVFENFFE